MLTAVVALENAIGRPGACSMCHPQVMSASATTTVLPALSSRTVSRATGPMPRYRADVDGLRAIAVLLVIGFHGFPQWVPGGFVGVDVFFVISGFLITNLILLRIDSQTFRLTEFYIRRIKRIFPALLVVLVAVCLYGWFALLPDEYSRVGKHMAGGAGFIANILFFREAGYFDAAASQKPLLHLWSLGVEEQFYLIWPLCLVLTAGRRHRTLAAIVSIGAASFLLNVARIQHHADEAFYLPQSRFWELMIGSLLAAAQGGLPGAKVRGLVHEALAGVGLVMIVYAGFAVDGSTLFPGWWALVPTLGAAIIIAAGPSTRLNRVVLSHPVAVGIGLISYSLYLWHWPLLSLARIMAAGEVSALLATGLISLAFVLAVSTYVLVEKPIRQSPVAVPTAIALIAGMVITFTGGWLVYRGRIDGRIDSQFLYPRGPMFPFPGPRMERIDSDGGHFFRRAGIAQTVLFVGDSNIEQYYPRLDWLLTEKPHAAKTIVLVTGGGCIPVPFVYESHHPHCEGITERAARLAANPSVDTIVIGALWSAYWRGDVPFYFVEPEHGPQRLTADEGIESLARALETYVRRFVDAGKAVVLLAQIPDTKAIDPRHMIQRSLLQPRPRIVVSPVSRREVVTVTALWTERLRTIARRTGATLIDPLDHLCNADVCRTMDEHGVPIYTDRGHLRPSYTREKITYLDAILLAAGP